MLYQFGALQVEGPGPFNATETEEEFGGDFAVKAVVGAQQPREPVGEADASFTLSGTLFPHFYARNGFATGLDEIELLKAMAAEQSPQMLLRGDGYVNGWYVIDRVSVKGSKLDANGIGRVQTYRIHLSKSPQAASPAQMMGTLELLFS